ncbi:MBOAT family protein [Kiloniella sp. EL199]|uniref:MBOAT family O-acyltransferase n=1 Tax=Kiloniella sp. EL199 TaxID=2107581 RepID=UPI000EA15D41|nr:MBOAT family protein [Kiloniella sp. EL199]
MVFSSLEFIYLFLPPVLLVFYLLRFLQWENGIVWWLIAASLAFYAWWSPIHLILLLFSVTANFYLHKVLLERKSRLVLTSGIIGNLGLLLYFKYADFLIGNVNAIAGSEIPLLGIVLPLAISFFTFQQISFLFDTYRGEIEQCNFSKYCLFVVFFPQLIAGPIVLQKHTIPQFTLKTFTQRVGLNFATGATLFVIGLFKKIVIADGIAPYSTSVFTLAEQGQALPIDVAWMGTIAYTFQIYFDFSGYCDMALGLARMFGIKLPLNFNSPYKAQNIVDFWRRWHITLSVFLRNYLYIPLGGNRKGPVRRYVNLTITMLLGGLWHGASWNFVFWGLLHGIYLSINHAWSAIGFHKNLEVFFHPLVIKVFYHALTLLGVMVAWIFFRAESFTGAETMLLSMFGQAGYIYPDIIKDLALDHEFFWFISCVIGFIIFFCPNSVEITRRYQPTIDYKSLLDKTHQLKARFIKAYAWRPSTNWSCAMLGVGVISLLQIYRLDELTEFIYFNF